MTEEQLLQKSNPRVIAFQGAADAEQEMALAGAHPEGVRLMSAAAGFVTLRADGVGLDLARKIKDTMLSVGGEAALAHAAWAGADEESSVILCGTRKHLKTLLKELCESGGPAAAMSDLLAGCLNNFCRRDFVLTLPTGQLPLKATRPLVMGILNITPDSFSDGGSFVRHERAVAHAMEMLAEGADIIDVGGESTRPTSLPVSVEEEIARVVPAIKEIASRTDKPISIDTTKPEVARAALDAGALIINDVTALGNEGMARLASERGCPVVLMHMKGTPRTMQKSPFYRDLMGEITLFLRERIEAAVAAGVSREQIVIDPGIGFGKTLEHNLEILRRLKVLRSLGRPILVGTSRKSFLGKITGTAPDERGLASAVSNALAVERGAHILRVHDVSQTRQAAAVAVSIAGGALPEECL